VRPVVEVSLFSDDVQAVCPWGGSGHLRDPDGRLVEPAQA
jgi:hypothetical protein